MHDASGCTGNYTGYDEARWYGSKSAVFCSGLRSIDAILGNDDKLIKKMKAAAKDIDPGADWKSVTDGDWCRFKGNRGPA